METDKKLTKPGSGSVLFELVSKDGHVVPIKFTTAQAAAEYAKAAWPDQEQDEDRTGAGWDVQVVGS